MKHLALSLLPIWLNVGVGFAVFAYALRASFDELRLISHERWLMARSLVAVFIVTPAIAIAVIKLIDLPPRVRLAIVALSFSIVAPALPHKLGQRKLRPYANALTLIVAAASIAVVPVLVDVMGRVAHHSYGVPPLKIAGYVGIVLGVPMVLGLVFRVQLPIVAARMTRPLTRFAFGFSAIPLVIEIMLSLPALWHLISVATILGMTLFTAAATGAGHLIGSPRKGDQYVLALSSATRHPAVAVTIGTANFPEQRFTTALMLCLIVNTIVTAIYVGWQRKRLEAPVGG